MLRYRVMLLRLASLLSLLLGVSSACVIDLPERALGTDGITGDAPSDVAVREASADRGRPPRDGAPVDDTQISDTQPLGDVTVDVAPTRCSSNADCLTLPSACHLAGSCNLASGVCEYPTKDCSSLDGPCSRGACEASSGNCVAQPINEGQPCGAVKACDAPGNCGGFSNTCDTSGTRSVTCRDYTCVAGTCSVGADYTNNESCTRTTDGDGCGNPTTTGCGSCGGYSGPCDQTGTQSCTCNTFACSGGSCRTNSTSCSENCTRSTNGNQCNVRQCAPFPEPRFEPMCCNNGQCTQVCGPCQ